MQHFTNQTYSLLPTLTLQINQHIEQSVPILLIFWFENTSVFFDFSFFFPVVSQLTRPGASKWTVPGLSIVVFSPLLLTVMLIKIFFLLIAWFVVYHCLSFINSVINSVAARGVFLNLSHAKYCVQISQVECSVMPQIYLSSVFFSAPFLCERLCQTCPTLSCSPGLPSTPSALCCAFPVMPICLSAVESLLSLQLSYYLVCKTKLPFPQPHMNVYFCLEVTFKISSELKKFLLEFQSFH